MKTQKLTTRALDKVILSLKKQMNETGNATGIECLYVPRFKRVLSSRYCKKGRPKKSDYDYVEINWGEMVGAALP